MLKIQSLKVPAGFLKKLKKGKINNPVIYKSIKFFCVRARGKFFIIVPAHMILIILLYLSLGRGQNKL